MTKYTVKLNTPLLGFRKDEVIVLDSKPGAIKLNAYWKKRIRDSKYDNCLELLSEGAVKIQNEVGSDKGKHKKPNVLSKAPKEHN